MTLSGLWNAWRKFGEKVSVVANTVILGVVYFVVVAPIAIIRKFGRKFGRERKRERTYWRDFNQEDSPESVRRQF